MTRAAAVVRLPFLLALATISMSALSPAAGADAHLSVHMAAGAKVVSVPVPFPIPRATYTIVLHTVTIPGFSLSVDARPKHEPPGEYLVTGPTNGGTCKLLLNPHRITCNYSFEVIGPGPYLIDFGRPAEYTPAVTIAMTINAAPTFH